jgi:hypothetical protein
VRVTNYNAALGRILASVLFCAAVGGLLYFALIEQAGWPQAVSIAAGAVVAVGGAALLCALPVLWVDISDNAVTVRRLFRSRTYARDDVRRWGFEATRGRALPTAPAGYCPFVIEFVDGTFFEVVVGPGKAAELETVIQAPAAGRTSAPG